MFSGAKNIDVTFKQCTPGQWPFAGFAQCSPGNEFDKWLLLQVVRAADDPLKH